MKYENIIPAVFAGRPNRFIAMAVPEDGAEPVPCHVKNTGRCKEILIPGARVYLEDHIGRMGKRKLRWTLIAVDKGGMTVNVDSQAPNALVREALEDGRIKLSGLGRLETVRPETSRGDSRFDFYVKDEEGREGFVEVKGVTLEEDGVAAFPDAPTERGVKHIEGLIRAKEEGFAAAAVFVIQMEGMKALVPNEITHPAFGDALRRAREAGVELLAFECRVKPDELELGGEIPVVTDPEEEMKLWNRIKSIFRKKKAEEPEETLKEAEGGLYPCPVCGKRCLSETGAWEICDNCGWEDDPVQRKDPDFEGGANRMSLNQAIEAYRDGRKVE
ncbi:MAG: DNA/RNA nuclease SfsA [Firmicutes bacterium]|nr:DNA/RNA nuclease SfsA [Bacillota bacterium]